MRLQEFVTVLVRDPRTQKEDSWHSYIDYEIFIHVSIKVSVQILRALIAVSVHTRVLFGILMEFLYTTSGGLEGIILLLMTEMQWNR